MGTWQLYSCVVVKRWVSLCLEIRLDGETNASVYRVQTLPVMFLQLGPLCVPTFRHLYLPTTSVARRMASSQVSVVYLGLHPFTDLGTKIALVRPQRPQPRQVPGPHWRKMAGCQRWIQNHGQKLGVKLESGAGPDVNKLVRPIE